MIKPAKSCIKRIKKTVRNYLNNNKAPRTEIVINTLNLSIRGLGNYYKHAVSKEIFGKADHAIWQMTWKWAKRRHPKKSQGWVKNKYYKRIKGRDWRFMEEGNPEPLFLLGSIPIRRHVRIIAEVNPYDPKYRDYLDKRLKRK